MKTLFKNIRIITPYEVLDEYGVIMKNEKIVDIIPENNINPNRFDKSIDGQGNYLSPGFIDIHNHGNSGYDIMDGTVLALDKIGEYHISNGVTSYLGTIITSSYEDIIKATKNIVDYENKNEKSNIIGIHLEGPFFNVGKKGAQPEKYIKEPNRDYISSIIDASKGRLKMVSLAPELDGSIGLIRFIKREGIAIAMGHSNATYDEAKLAIDNGTNIATHLYNGMRGFDHREPGIVGAALMDDRVYCEVIYDRFHLHDMAVELALKVKGYDKIVLVSDAMMATGLEDGKYVLGGQEVFVSDGKPRLKSGNIAGSTLNLQKAVHNMVKYLQVPINIAVKMASLNPARAINMDKDLGSIEIGKRADLILFDEEINIKEVYNGGSLAYKNADYQEL